MPWLSPSPTVSRFLSPSKLHHGQGQTTFLLLVMLAVSAFLAGAVESKVVVQQQVVDEQRLRQDLPAGSLLVNKAPETKHSDVVDVRDREQNFDKQIVAHQDVVELPKGPKDVPSQQDQEKGERFVEERRNEDLEERERKKLHRQQQIDERERILSERLKWQQQQQESKDNQQNFLEAQREKQRQQQWLAEVQRKSQEVLAGRQQKLQDPQQQKMFNDDVLPAVHSREDPAQLKQQQPPGLSPNSRAEQAAAAGGINSSIIVHRQSGVNASASGGSANGGAGSQLNNNIWPEHRTQSLLGVSGERSRSQGREKLVNELQSLVNGNQVNGEEVDRKVGQGPSGGGVQNRGNNSASADTSIDRSQHSTTTTSSSLNQNVNNGFQNGQNSNMNFNPLNVMNSNSQWSRYEFGNNNNNNNNNNQQQYQQQQHQQQQPQIGGINLSWDWEDFAISFTSYGAAEMKVRRAPHPTTGEPWPMPQYYSKKDDKIYKVSKELHFIPTGVICDILEEGLTRHLQRTLRGSVEDMYDNLQNAEGSPIEDPALRYEKEEFLNAPLITRVEIKVKKQCEKYPSLESDESYDLVIKKKKTYIWANEVWGALRGLETFGHLVWRGTDGSLYIKETVISDYPRFPHRGLHIDTSRHYLFKEVILDILDSMEMNKLNVFHWHIVDDQSFPYESRVYPELSRKGAFHPTYVYTLDDIAEIIEYARLRGIRVMPEFDTPGHTYAWGLSRPELLTQCYSGSMPVKGYLGPIDPSKNSTYRFLQTLFKEIVEVFKDQYLHLGGDEVPLGCWQSNPEVMAFAQELAKKPRDTQQQSQQSQNSGNSNFGGWSMWSDDIRRVYEYYENRLISIVNELGQKRKKGIKYVMWQEVMNNNLQLPNDTIIQVWMGDMGDVMRATSMGYQVIYSTCWYMDHIEYGTKWPKYYNCDPVDQSFGYHIDEKKVLGGEAAFWAEYFSNENLIPLMWPRASAAAERLWSSKEVKNLDRAAERLSEHRCRMIKRGINAGEISGPGYCLHAPPKRRLYNDTAGCKGGNCSRTHNFVQIEDFEVHVSQRGVSDCANVFTQGNGNMFIMLTLALVIMAGLYALSKSSSRFHRMRICKNRSILIVFMGVLLVYILCYTTVWMRAFEFSGSFHKTLQEDNHSGSERKQNGNSPDFKPIDS